MSNEPVEDPSDVDPPDETSSTSTAAETVNETDDMAEEVKTALRSVVDPELGINIVDLGLVYDIEVDGGSATITMTLTSPGCPAGGQIMGGAKDAAESLGGIDEAVVSLVWKPFWTPERIDPKVRAMMGF